MSKIDHDPSIDRMAQQDAHDWARAEMFFGEGAGVRRRHLEAQIAQKVENLSGYNEAFQKYYSVQDMAEHAIAAAKERQKLDRVASAGKNLRALKRGDIRGLSTGVYVVVGAAFLAHKTGYDKVALAKAKELKKRAEIEFKIWNARRQGKNVERIYS